MVGLAGAEAVSTLSAVRQSCVLHAATAALRSKTSFMLQDPTLLVTTVHDNIAFGAPEGTSREQVEWAARAAQAHDFITEKLDGGFDHVFSGDTKLSGGQRQRILLARALCRRPALLLLDECTSVLDEQAATQVIRAIATRSATTGLGTSARGT